MKTATIAASLLVAATLPAGAVTYEEWRAVRFTPAELADLSISGRFADPDGDGRNNLGEFAEGTDPRNADFSPPVTTVMDGDGKLVISFPRWTSASRIIHIPQLTPDLRARWRSGPANFEALPAIPLSAGSETELAGFRTVGSTQTVSRLFVRLMVDLDSDGDGLPDTWELLNGLNPNDPYDAVSDYDFDGRTAMEEFTGGTDALLADLPPPAVPVPAAPANVQYQKRPDGSILVTWDDNSDNEDYFIIRMRMPDGTMREVGRTRMNEQFFIIPAPQ